METRPFAKSKMITLNRASCRFAAVLLFAPMLSLLCPDSALTQSIRSHDEAARVVIVDKFVTEDGNVSGEIHNRSSRALRDVELLIRHTWLWKNEFKPGKDDPGGSVYYTVPGEVPAQGTVPFKYALSWHHRSEMLRLRLSMTSMCFCALRHNRKPQGDEGRD